MPVLSPPLMVEVQAVPPTLTLGFLDPTTLQGKNPVRLRDQGRFAGNLKKGDSGVEGIPVSVVYQPTGTTIATGTTGGPNGFFQTSIFNVTDLWNRFQTDPLPFVARATVEGKPVESLVLNLDVLLPSLTIQTDKTVYKEGKTIIVTGTLMENGIPSDQPVQLLIDGTSWLFKSPDVNGAYRFDVPAIDIGVGSHTLQTKSFHNVEGLSIESPATFLTVEEAPPEPPEPPTPEEWALLFGVAIALPVTLIATINILGNWPPRFIEDIQRRARARKGTLFVPSLK